MDKKQGTSATRAKNKYNAANYDRLSPAKAKGYSLNEFMERAMDKLAEEILGE